MNIRQARLLTPIKMIRGRVQYTRAHAAFRVISSLDPHVTESQLEAALKAKDGIGPKTIELLEKLVKTGENSG